MTKSRTRCPSSASSSQLGIGTSSNLISKLKPKIRIIHVYAPEVIKTDAANFRELVQRLTGKPEHEEEEEKGGRRRKTKTPPKRLDPMMIMEEQEQELMLDVQNGLRTEKEGENNDNGKFSSGGGFLEGFSSEFDCFMEEFSTMPVV
ncbi:hypothetical protein K1719_012737 [Acacia pycnantha]|nr:hypothetical protein K1719_012737 [Acacia pycnantha]